jgi:hypothetical protein
MTDRSVLSTYLLVRNWRERCSTRSPQPQKRTTSAALSAFATFICPLVVSVVMNSIPTTSACEFTPAGRASRASSCCQSLFIQKPMLNFRPGSMPARLLPQTWMTVWSARPSEIFYRVRRRTGIGHKILSARVTQQQSSPDAPNDQRQTKIRSRRNENEAQEVILPRLAIF